MTRGTPAVEVVHDPDRHLGTTVVDAVGEAAGVAPNELPFELNDYVDPDALDALFATRPDGTSRAGGRVVFRVEGHGVTIDAESPDRVVVRVE